MLAKNTQMMPAFCTESLINDIKGIVPKGPFPPCLRMADRALLAGYPRYTNCIIGGLEIISLQ